DRRLQEDGLQGPLPAAAAAGALGLAPRRCDRRSAVRAAGLNCRHPACRAMTIVWFQPNIVSNSSLPFKTTITAATIHARAAVVREIAKSPIFRSSETHRTSGL